ERNELSHKPEDYSAFERIMIWPLDAPADCIDWVRTGRYGSRICWGWNLLFIHALHREEKSVESHQKRFASPFLSPVLLPKLSSSGGAGLSLIILRVTLRTTDSNLSGHRQKI